MTKATDRCMFEEIGLKELQGVAPSSTVNPGASAADDDHDETKTNAEMVGSIPFFQHGSLDRQSV
jgi:hypothetical protein